MFKGVDYSSAGGGSQPIEITKEEYDALGDEKLTDNKLYFIKDYAESYAMNGKGMVSKVLWSGSASATGNQITLNNSYKDYDLIYIHSTVTDDTQVRADLVKPDDIPLKSNNQKYIITASISDKNRRVMFNAESDTSLYITYADNMSITKIIGLKFCAATACYSTDEQIVGRWIDGKPVYQKTFTGYADSATISFNIPSVETLISCNYNFDNFGTPSANIITIGSYSDNSNDNSRAFINKNDGTFNFISGGSYPRGNYIVTLQYTKTTD